MLLNIIKYLLSKCELTKPPFYILDKYEKFNINILYEDYKTFVIEYPKLYTNENKNNQQIFIQKWDSIIIPDVIYINIEIYYNDVKITVDKINRIFNGDKNISGISLRQLLNKILLTKKEYNLNDIQYNSEILSIYFTNLK